MTTIRTTSGITYGQLVEGTDIWVGGKHGLVTSINREEIVLEIIVTHKDEVVSLVGRRDTRTMRRARFAPVQR